MTKQIIAHDESFDSYLFFDFLAAWASSLLRVFFNADADIWFVIVSLGSTYLALTWLVTTKPNMAVTANVKYQTKNEVCELNQFEFMPRHMDEHASTNNTVPDVAWYVANCLYGMKRLTSW